jgi:L-fuconolactonase
MDVRRLDGRDEPILLPDLPIIDAHFHLFVRPTIQYMFEECLEDVRAGHNIVSSVYVETQAFSRAEGPEIERTLGEVEFANGIGAMAGSGFFGPCRIAAGIVAHARLSGGDAIGAVLDQALERAPDRLRGVREILIDHVRAEAFRGVPHRPPQGLISSTAFREGFRHLGPRGLSFDATVFDPQLSELADLARSFPDTPIILNHMGMAMAIDLDANGRREVFQTWRVALNEIAQLPNLSCKISGLGMPIWGLGFDVCENEIGYRELAEAWRPYAETALECFGPDRCMMASNYPPDARSAGFVPLWNALKHIVRGYSDAELTSLFSGTAANIYRLAI